MFCDIHLLGCVLIFVFVFTHPQKEVSGHSQVNTVQIKKVEDLSA